MLNLNGLKLREKQTLRRALDVYSANPFLDFEDALSVAHMERQQLTAIVSYDTDFDKVANMTRIEPKGTVSISPKAAP